MVRSKDCNWRMERESLAWCESLLWPWSNRLLPQEAWLRSYSQIPSSRRGRVLIWAWSEIIDHLFSTQLLWRIPQLRCSATGKPWDALQSAAVLGATNLHQEENEERNPSEMPVVASIIEIEFQQRPSFLVGQVEKNNKDAKHINFLGVSYMI